MRDAGRATGAERPAPSAGVRVQAPGRLHLGFLDPAATLGRRFGSVGLVVDGFETVVEMAHGDADRFESAPLDADDLERARAHVAALRRATGVDAPLQLRLRCALPPHAGLGSGTQLALAVGRAFATLFELDLDTARVATLLGRGARSGVGIAGFDQGGLLVDGGPRADGSAAALLARVEVPQVWRVILALDPHRHGLSGSEERAALATLAPLTRSASAAICHEVLMRVLPGAAGAEFAPFAAGVSEIQRVLGAHFAPAQDGRACASAAVGRLLDWIAGFTVAGCGQSSWGPTGFAIVDSADTARRVLSGALAAGIVDPALRLVVTSARNHGAVIGPLAADDARPAPLPARPCAALHLE